MKMKKKKLHEGFLEFTSDEVKFHFDEARKITGIKGRHQGKAEELIEFLMLLHNMTVTNYFVSHELPFVARNHDKPNQEKLLAWNSLLGQRGYKIDNKKNFTNEDIRKRLESYEGKDEQVILDNLAVRSQSKAGYGANSIGHYALGFENYATFTSPIRRLADFINQRVLKDSIHYGDKYAIEKWTPKMEYLAKIATDTERNAEKVERKMTDIRKAEYMSEHIGDKWTGLVSEVGYNYIKVILPNMIQGKVFISSKDYILSKDYFSLTSKDGSERILVGDKINVQAVKADIDTGEITFIRQSTKVRSNNEEKESCKKRVKKR